MRKIKANSASFWSARSLLFIVLWAGNCGVAALLTNPLLELIRRTVASSSLYPIAAVLVVSLIIVSAAMVQVQLVERLLKHSMRGWMLYSIMGAFLTMLGFGATRNRMIVLTSNPAIYPDFFDYLVFFTAVLVPIPFLQALWLRNRVHSAGLYALSGLLVTLWLAFILPERGWGSYLISTLLVYFLVQGAVMRYLWIHPRYTEKGKIDFDIDEQSSIESRAARLQTSESLPATWHTRDDHAAQRRDQ